MRKLITLTILCLFSIQSMAQDLCAEIAEVQNPNTRKIVLTYGSPMADIICEKLTTLKYLQVKLDGEQYTYQLFNCNASENKVVYIPLNDNMPPVQSYEVLELIFPNGELATYSSYSSSSMYSGTLTDCFFDPNAAVPTLSQWGFIILSLIMSIIGISSLKAIKFSAIKIL